MSTYTNVWRTFCVILLGVVISHQSFGQGECYNSLGCSDYGNFGYNSTTAATLEYDNYVSSFHSSAVRDIDGTLKVWGELSHANGYEPHLTPTPVIAANYPGLTGTPLKIGMGSASRNNVQFIMLTDDNKLWAWGAAGAVVSENLTQNVTARVENSNVLISPFQELPIGLPAGVSATDVKMMFVTYRTIVITTCGGEVYTLTQSFWVSGVNTSVNPLIWNKVQKASGGDLTGIVATRGSERGMIALDETGGLWVWGSSIWDGTSTSAINSSRAVPMLKPAAATGNIKMIGGTSTTTNTFYVLYENGNLYALGSNDRKQLGNWDPDWVEGNNSTASPSWVQPRYSAGGPVMNNIKWISPQEHDALYAFINVITNDKKLYNWGQESGYCLGRGVNGSPSSTVSLDPGEPTSFETGHSNTGIIATESGGHTTMLLRECVSNFGYIGHRIHGSMGDNNDADHTDNTVHFNTYAIQVCGAPTVDARVEPSVVTDYCIGRSFSFVGYPAGGVFSIDPSSTATATLNPSTGDITLTGAGTLRVNYEVMTSTECGVVTVDHLINVTDCDALITIPGNVWVDANGDAVYDSGETGISNAFWAVLVGPDGQVIASTLVNNDGTFVFQPTVGQLSASGSYAVILTNSQVASGQPAPDAGTPQNGYVYTGTNRGDALSADTGNSTGGINLGDLSLVAGGTTLDPANFGIQTPPVADPKSYSVGANAFSSTPPAGYPIVTGYNSLPASSNHLTGYPAKGSLTGSDREDCPGDGDCNTGTSTTFEIASVNPNTRLYYDFGGDTGIVEIDITGGPVRIPDFDVDKLVIYGQEGSGTVGQPYGFTYSIVDQAGSVSAPVDYLIIIDPALPVNFVNFTVTREENSVSLRWTTTDETDNQGFEVQRSADGQQWAAIGFVKAAATTNGKAFYHFADPQPLSVLTYYRLKQLDHNGGYMYSPVRTVAAGVHHTFVYPNPVTDGVLYLNLNEAGKGSIEVMNASGVKVLEQRLNPSHSLDVSTLRPGMYILRLISETGESNITHFIVP